MNNRIILLLILILLTFFSSGCEGLIPGEDELAGTQWRLNDWSDSSWTAPQPLDTFLKK